MSRSYLSIGVQGVRAVALAVVRYDARPEKRREPGGPRLCHLTRARPARRLRPGG